MAVIDTHTHLANPEWLDLLKAHGGPRHDVRPIGEGPNVNAWMVREGWALAYRRYSTDYVAAENSAKEARRGIW